MIILACRECGSSDLTPTYNNTFECRSCGRHLGFWQVLFARTNKFQEVMIDTKTESFLQEKEKEFA